LDAVRSVAKVGFRKWYERRLIEAHAWLVTAVLCAVVFAVLFEGVSLRGNLLLVLGPVGTAFAAILICGYGVRRVLQILAEAERFGRQATCAKCGAYGRFSVEDMPAAPAARCRKCAHRWLLQP
jgi:DNA-directed RNA polymerase subunit RPC12/RpoP